MKENYINTKDEKNIKYIIISILALVLLALGAAMQVKSAVGLSPWDALTATISEITGLKFGTASMVSNFIMIGLQLLILRRRFKLSYWTQVPIVLGFGYVVNFFLYKILQFNLDQYWFRIIFFVVGNNLAALANSFLVTIDTIIMPPEGFSSAVAKVSDFEFSKVRFSLDLVSVAFCLMSTLLMSTTLQIREGTIIGIFIYNISLRLYMKLIGPRLKKVKE